jgi:hypothetical protein
VLSLDSVIGCQELRTSRLQGQLKYGTDADSMVDDRFCLESKVSPHHINEAAIVYGSG